MCAHGLQGKDDIIWFVKQYLSGPKHDPKDPLASPLFAEDFSGLPASLIITAEVKSLHICVHTAEYPGCICIRLYLYVYVIYVMITCMYM